MFSASVESQLHINWIIDKKTEHTIYKYSWKWKMETNR